MWQCLWWFHRFWNVDFTKSQKSRYLENEKSFFLQIKKSLITHQGSLYCKKIVLFPFNYAVPSMKSNTSLLLQKWKCKLSFSMISLFLALLKSHCCYQFQWSICCAVEETTSIFPVYVIILRNDYFVLVIAWLGI